MDFERCKQEMIGVHLAHIYECAAEHFGSEYFVKRVNEEWALFLETAMRCIGAWRCFISART